MSDILAVSLLADCADDILH